MSEPKGHDKVQWRAWAHRIWSELDIAATSEAIVFALSDWGGIRGTVLTYLPMPGEVDLSGLDDTHGVRWVVTRTPNHGPLTVHVLEGTLERHPLGFMQPVVESPSVELGEIDSILVPGLVFDETGGRLGRGKGYYDELLGRFPIHTARIGVAPLAVVVASLPTESHDQPMSHLATEDGVVQIGGRAAVYPPVM